MLKSEVLRDIDATELESVLREDKTNLRQYFTAFRSKGSLLKNVMMSKSDVYKKILKNNNIGGFFCLRGIDEGFDDMMFGVYICDSFRRQGLGTFALQCAIEICSSQGWNLKLKVHKENYVAIKIYQRHQFKPEKICPASGQLVMRRSHG